MIIVILRNPIERAFSAWQYLRGTGREGLRDFRDGLAAEEERRAQGYGPIWWYVGTSLYHLGLQQYLEKFPASQLHCLTTEEFRRDPTGAMSRVCRFLGVDDEQLQPLALSREVNRSGVPRLEMLTRALYPSYRLHEPLARIAPPAVRRLVRKARAASLDGGQRMAPEARFWLAERLAAVPLEVHKLTGIDTSHWETSYRPSPTDHRGR